MSILARTGTRSSTAALLLFLALVLGLAGCGGGDDDADETATAEDSEPADDDAAETDSSETTTSTASSGTESVDVCAIISADDVAAATGGTYGEGEPKPASGSLLGECDFVSSDPTGDAPVIVAVSARPANEYSASVDAANKIEDVSGVGSEAAWTEAGLLVLFPDFMVQLVGPDDMDVAVEIAKTIDA